MEPTQSLFLHLPVELRLHVYSYLVTEVALMIPFSDYAGLLYSCKQIHQEMEPELLKGIPEFFEKWTHSYITPLTIPRTISEVRNLTVIWPNKERAGASKSMMGLIYLYQNCLTIRSSGLDSYQDQRDMRELARKIGRFYQWDRTPRARRIVYDWSRNPCFENKALIMDSHGALCRNDAWQMEVKRNNEGKLVSATFERVLRKRPVRPSRLTKTVVSDYQV